MDFPNRKLSQVEATSLAFPMEIFEDEPDEPHQYRAVGWWNKDGLPCQVCGGSDSNLIHLEPVSGWTQ